MQRFLWGLLAAAVCAAATSATAQEGADLPKSQYNVDLRDAPRHYVTVTAEIPSAEEATTLMLPVWAPGSYVVREFARHIVEIAAFDRRGNELELTKTTKNRWVVQNPKKLPQIRVVYRVYCREKSVRTNWVDDQYALLQGAATYLARPDLLDAPATVTLVLPDGWRRSATSLRSDGDRPHQYSAESYHELVDSPIVAGRLEVFPFQAGGVTHALVNVNDFGFWDGSRAVRDLTKMVEAHQAMWGRVPYDRYLFLNIIGPTGGGGLEHDNCCVLEAGQWVTGDEGSYRGWLSLCSHEFFHAWNVRRLRPRELVAYDYENENYTPSLWVAEGITSYYQDLLLVRAGLADESSMMGELSGMVSGIQSTPGRLKQSLRDSSHDAWIKYYKPGETTRTAEISYYTKGAVVGWLLDVEIRRASQGQKSLDDALRLLYRRFAGRRGYTPADFCKVCSTVAGADLTEFFARSVDSTGELDYQTAATWLGLDIGPVKPADESARESADPPAAAEENTGAAEKSPAEAAAEAQREAMASAARGGSTRRPRRSGGSAWTGISVRNTDGRMVVSAVAPDSPADLEGITLDDEILAVNDLRVTGDLDSRLRPYAAGDSVELLIARDQRVIRIPVKLATRTFEFWSVSVSGSDNSARRQRRDSWLKGTPAESPATEGDEQPDP